MGKCCGYLDLRAFQSGWVRHMPRLCGSSRQWSSTQRGFSVRFHFSSPSRSMGQSDHNRTPVLLRFSGEAPLGDGDGTVAGAGEAAEEVKGWRPNRVPRRDRAAQDVLPQDERAAGILNTAASHVISPAADLNSRLPTV